MQNTRFAKAAGFGILMLAMFATLAHPLLSQVEPDASTELYAATTASLSTNSGSYVNVPGLAITLPAATPQEKFATITLNMPDLYMTGGTPGDTLGSAVAIAQSGALLAVGQISSDVAVGTTGAELNGRKPLTVVVKIPLGSSPTTVTAAWGVSRSTVVNSDNFASLSALLTTK